MNTEEQTTENQGIESFIQFFEKHKNNAIAFGIALIVFLEVSITTTMCILLNKRWRLQIAFLWQNDTLV